MFELKKIHSGAIPRAMERARTYRLLNEPREAESICRDVLTIDADNQEALVSLLLAISDQFGAGMKGRVDEARSLLSRLTDEHDRLYYAGVIEERGAKVLLAGGHSGDIVYDWFRKALECYEKAEAIAPRDQNDATLRWNTVVRILQRHADTVRPREDIQPTHHSELSEHFDDEVPYR